MRNLVDDPLFLKTQYKSNETFWKWIKPRDLVQVYITCPETLWQLKTWIECMYILVTIFVFSIPQYTSTVFYTSTSLEIVVNLNARDDEIKIQPCSRKICQSLLSVLDRYHKLCFIVPPNFSLLRKCCWNSRKGHFYLFPNKRLWTFIVSKHFFQQ